MSDLPPILCPDCEHDIDCHALHEPCADCWQTAAFDGAVDPCRQQPSDIARALLAVEPEPACPVHDLYGDHPLGAEDVTGCTCERKDRP